MVISEEASEFLGRIIEDRKVLPSPSKIDALIKFPVPTNLKQLQSFLGLEGYFRKFISKFSLIAKPLSDLTRSNTKFEMKDQQIQTFNTLKNVLSKEPVLSIFNQQYETEVHTDASIDDCHLTSKTIRRRQISSSLLYE